MDRFLRRATPFALLALAALVWFERWIPGAGGFAARFGDDAVPRFVIGLLCLYVLLLVIERQRMEGAFKQVLGAFREFHRGGAAAGPGGLPSGAAGGKPPAGVDPAVPILIGALASADVEVRRSCVQHLKRLTGEDLGDDPVAWRRWWRSRAEAAPPD